MKTAKQSLSHLERTVDEPRDDALHRVTLARIDRINSTIRLFQLKPVIEEGRKPITFLPGQWLDVYVPSIPKAGGFTITSPPSLPYLELAIQKSPLNPPAAWLWQDEKEILGAELKVRVGGSFVWPPLKGLGRGEAKEEGIGEKWIKRVVFVAGGVGINPLMSIVSLLAEKKSEGGSGFKVVFLYSTKDSGEEILFLERLRKVFEGLGEEGELRVFLTGGNEGYGDRKVKGVDVIKRRIEGPDLLDALGPVEERKGTVCYVCGVPTMTDEYVETVKRAEGMEEENVLFEKWW